MELSGETGKSFLRSDGEGTADPFPSRTLELVNRASLNAQVVGAGS
jgi:hypothetical protein